MIGRSTAQAREGPLSISRIIANNLSGSQRLVVRAVSSCVYKSLKCHTLPFVPFFPLPEAALRPNNYRQPLSHGMGFRHLCVREVVTKIPGFPRGVGFRIFLDRDPGPPFHRRELHPIRLGVGEWRSHQSPSPILTSRAVAQLTQTRSVCSCPNP